MPRLITLDKRQNHSLWWEIYDDELIDLNNNFDANNIRRIIEDTNDRHNRGLRSPARRDHLNPQRF
jgi:hypothetical protein